MNDKELADRIVALLPDYWSNNEGASVMTPDGMVSAERFVRDWRVAGALMEAKAWGVNTVRKGDEWEAHVVPIGQIREYIARNESAPRAINEACVEALT